MTVSEQLRAEGIQQGLQQGLQQGVQKVAQRLLSQNFDEMLVAQLTELPLEQIKALKEKALN